MQPRAVTVEPEISTYVNPIPASGVTNFESTKSEAAPLLCGTISGWSMRFAFLASDLISMSIGCIVAMLSTNLLTSSGWWGLSGSEVKSLIVLSAGLIIAAFWIGSYGPIPPRPARQFRGWVIGTLYSAAGLLMVLGMFGVGSRRIVLLVSIAAFVSLFQAAFQRALCRMQFGKKNWWGTRFIVVGDGDEAVRAFDRMRIEPQWGIRPVGIVSETLTKTHSLALTPYLGQPSQIDEIAAKYHVGRAILVAHWFDAEDRVKLITHGTQRIRQWIALPAPVSFPSLWLDTCEVARLPGWAVRRHLSMPALLTIKRMSDFVITTAVGIALLPLIAVIAILIKLTSRGSVFYAQRRMGRDGKAFMAWKFRTMYPDSDRLLNDYLAANPHMALEWEANHKLKSDPRVTWIGRKLRSTSLDELPQLWNVLIGEMSLVGPRPIVSAEIEKYGEVYDLYRKVPPGITGLWQVSGRNNTTYEERVELDTYYVHNWSVWLDMYILACTIKVVLLGEGAY